MKIFLSFCLLIVTSSLLAQDKLLSQQDILKAQKESQQQFMRSHLMTTLKWKMKLKKREAERAKKKRLKETERKYRNLF